MARYQLAKKWDTTPICMGILPQAVVGVLPSLCVYFFFLNKRRNVGIYKWNEKEIELRRTILSNVKPLQILTSVTQNQVLALQVWHENDLKLGVNVVKPGKTRVSRIYLDILGSHKCLMLVYSQAIWYEITSKWQLVARPMLWSSNQSSLNVIDRTTSRTPSR